MSHASNGRTKSEQSSASNGRDAQGRFGPGNAGGPGNPFARRVAELRSAFVSAISREEMHKLARQLLVEAEAGDRFARKLVLQYCLGKPAAPANPDRVNHDEWQLLKERPSYDDILNQKNRMDFRHAWALNYGWDLANDHRMKDLRGQLYDGVKKPGGKLKMAQR
jgi:hypothetical protein